MAKITEAASWTEPFYGVSHFRGAMVPGVRQITITEYRGGFVDVRAFGLCGFEHIEEARFKTVEQAREWAAQFEARAKAAA